MNDFDQLEGCRSSIPPGWLDLVERLHRRILRIVPDYELEDVKEKYGTLRYYVALPAGDQALYSAVEALIDQAEDESAHTCQMCGGPGELFDDSHPEWTTEERWFRTRCGQHRHTTWQQWGNQG